VLATTTAVVCRVTAGATGLLSTALDYSYYTAALASTLLCRKEKRKGAYPILRLQRYTHIDPNNGIRAGYKCVSLTLTGKKKKEKPPPPREGKDGRTVRRRTAKEKNPVRI